MDVAPFQASLNQKGYWHEAGDRLSRWSAKYNVKYNISLGPWHPARNMAPCLY